MKTKPTTALRRRPKNRSRNAEDLPLFVTFSQLCPLSFPWQSGVKHLLHGGVSGEERSRLLCIATSRSRESLFLSALRFAHRKAAASIPSLGE